MSHLINDELIWVSIPKCASYSIENSLLKSKLNIKKYNQIDTIGHHHIPLNECLSKFGNKESICITRDWFSKWISSLNFIWDYIEFRTDYKLICKWEDVDNEFIYNTFNNKLLNYLHSANEDGYKKCLLKLIKSEEKNKLDITYTESSIMMTLISEKYWKSNQKCTYEFDIKDIDKFINFIENRFGQKLIINNSNISSKRPNKIIINDELKTFVWDRFEKIYVKRYQLI
jgi:hypothetical protein